MTRTLICGALTSALLLALPVLADVSYSAVNDFPVVGPSTPAVSANGVWSYGYSASLSPVVLTPGTASPDYFGDGKAAGFSYAASASLPTVLKNISGGTLNNEGSTIGPWPTSELLLHPDSGGDYAIVRFTAPTTTTYMVSGLFVEIGNNDQPSNGATSDSVNITTSGPVTSNIFSATTLNTTAPQTFSFSQSMVAGESLDFAVGLGPQGQFSYDSTGFSATISATPEPAFYALLGVGLCGLFVVVKVRRSA